MTYKIILAADEPPQKINENIIYLPETIVAEGVKVQADEMTDPDFVEEIAGSACISTPTNETFYRACGDTGHVYFLVSSSSYKKAARAVGQYKAVHPDKEAHVFMTESAGERDLLIIRIDDLEKRNIPYDQIIDSITKYLSSVHVLTVTIGKAGFCLIKSAGRLCRICRKSAVSEGVMKVMKKKGYNGRRVNITTGADRAVSLLKYALKTIFPFADIQSRPSVYGSKLIIGKDGMIITFEDAFEKA